VIEGITALRRFELGVYLQPHACLYIAKRCEWGQPRHDGSTRVYNGNLAHALKVHQWRSASTLNPKP